MIGGYRSWDRDGGFHSLESIGISQQMLLFDLHSGVSPVYVFHKNETLGEIIDLILIDTMVVFTRIIKRKGGDGDGLGNEVS